MPLPRKPRWLPLPLAAGAALLLLRLLLRPLSHVPGSSTLVTAYYKVPSKHSHEEVAIWTGKSSTC